MNSAYWHQRANPWVSASVLVGGLVSALLLVFIYKVDSQVDNFSVVSGLETSDYLN